MRFAKIDVPQELIAAHSDGEVVFFVGAGASMPAPTKLPSFIELTREIAHLTASTPPTGADLAEPDVYLGRLDADPAIDVHGLVERRIRLGRYRNPLHDALAKLATASGHPRIVTTNYDNHLHNALKQVGVRHAVFEAPALPAGNDFEGLVHLHGRLGQPARRLVVTDSDFGTAYITRGWAPDFLRDVFAHFVVCFIGYSHNDRMMEYLAKGLPSQARARYIITDEDDPAKWKRLRISPILYAHREHHLVVDLLNRWGTWARDTPFDRAAHIRLLSGGTPPADPDDHDFLVASVEDPRLAQEVCRVATGAEWIDWMVQRKPFRFLVGDEKEPFHSEILRCVASWVAREGIGTEEGERLEHAVAQASGPIHDTLFSAVLEKITYEEVDDKQRSVWLRWLLRHEDRRRTEAYSLGLLWASQVKLSWADSLLLVDHLANKWQESRPVWHRGFQPPDLTDDWYFREGIRRLRDAPDDDGLREVLNWLTSYLELTHYRIKTYGSGFDRWSFARASIEPHEQDRQGGGSDPSDVLIDLARDTLAEMRRLSPEVAVVFRSIWLASNAPLLRRLALNDLARSTSEPSDLEAILWDREAVFDRELRHEIYELLAVSLPAMSDEQITMLVDRIAEGPQPRGRQGDPLAQSARDRSVFDLLHWVTRHRTDLSAPEALSAIQTTYPKWREDDQSSFRSFVTVSSRSIEDDWPWQPDELHRMIDDDAIDATEQLEAHPAKDADFGWWGAGNLLARTVERWPDDGFLLWPVASKVVRACIIVGWSGATMSDAQLDGVASRLLDIDLQGLDHELAGLLRPWTSDVSLRDRWISRPQGRELARRACAAVRNLEVVASSDLYTQAINTTPGILAEYWIGVAVQEAREGVYPGGGLSSEVAAALQDLLTPSSFAPLAQAALLRQLNFIHRVDPQWAREHLLSEIDPELHPWSEIEALWSVLLSGQLSDDLLDDGFLRWITQAAGQVEPSAGIAKDFSRVAALVAVHSGMDDSLRLEWLTDFTAGSPVDVTVLWLQEVTEQVAGLEPDAQASLWRRWMFPYLSRRVVGVPRTLTAAEVTALVGWLLVVRSEPELRAGIDALLRAQVGLAPAHGLWHGFDLPTGGIQKWPDLWVRLLTGLLQRTFAPPHGLQRHLRLMLTSLEGALHESVALQTLRAEMYRLFGA
ncbi:SIR2 family protein [Cellulomonas sp. NPDC055163]